MTIREVFARHASPDRPDDRHTRDVKRLSRQLDRDGQTRARPAISLPVIHFPDPEQERDVQ